MTELVPDVHPPTNVPGVSAGPPLAIVVDLCDALARAGVRFCHFKSNEAIARSASGDNDLDLLVDPGDVDTFERTLTALRFVRALSAAPRRFPGIHDFFGFDAPSGRLVHVHAHYALVVGHDATKNVRLPFERAYLASATTSPSSIFPLPSPDYEYVLLVLRLTLKHATIDAVAGGQGGVPAGARRELSYLLERIDRASVRDILDRDLPDIPAHAFDAAARALRDGGPIDRVRAAHDLRRALETYARRSAGTDTLVRIAGRVTWNVRRIAFPRTTSKRLDGVGRIVAVLGSDGSGKTTVLDSLDRWLATSFRTERVHLGKPPRGVGSIAVRALQRVARGSSARRRLWELRHVLIARDRFRAYRHATKAASRGTVVLCDRFPTSFIDRMDAPMLGGARAGVLPRLERAYYARIAPPDVTIVLDVSPEVAMSRRPSDDPTEIAARAKAIHEAAWGAAAIVIDAERSPQDVLAMAKAAVWDGIA